VNVQKLTYFTVMTQGGLEGKQEAVTDAFNSMCELEMSHKMSFKTTAICFIYLSIYNTNVGVSEVYAGFHG
jgi:hypothetical protein